MAREVDVEEVQATLSELLQWAEAHHDRVAIRRNGKVVAELVPTTPEEAEGEGADWLPEWAGMLADHPDVAEAIDQAYHDRSLYPPKPPPDLGPGDGAGT